MKSCPVTSLKLLKTSRVSGKNENFAEIPEFQDFPAGAIILEPNLPHSLTLVGNLMAAVNLMMPQSVRHKNCNYTIYYYTFTIISRLPFYRSKILRHRCRVLCLCERTQPISC